ncbi:hypothetical protein JJB27_03605 [Campylobacter fetus subsp. venerealis]|uniref:hypothetical protein n=1 Tax=Campylobacter fetus TaxID=196 RepID=UPI00081875B1|nr:hypothetical protein [Campylobacter fetus]MBK3498162.1 hypothetical protein [Campylobacter fetus subsp. venerealis]MBK3502206.1 hypothetical protein [Campylobacter fetus subsp. venerealis]OCS16799.1 hypothetical protein CfvWBT01109_01820 [Campylobacter fetus subsp. venerealis]
MIAGFIEFLGLNSKINAKKQAEITNSEELGDSLEEYVIELESPYYEEEITTETVIKNGKKIEIKRIKTKEPLNGGKTLVSTKVYKKEIARK